MFKSFLSINVKCINCRKNYNISIILILNQKYFQIGLLAWNTTNEINNWIWIEIRKKLICVQNDFKFSLLSFFPFLFFFYFWTPSKQLFSSGTSLKHWTSSEVKQIQYIVIKWNLVVVTKIFLCQIGKI